MRTPLWCRHPWAAGMLCALLAAACGSGDDPAGSGEVVAEDPSPYLFEREGWTWTRPPGDPLGPGARELLARPKVLLAGELVADHRWELKGSVDDGAGVRLWRAVSHLTMERDEKSQVHPASTLSHPTRTLKRAEPHVTVERLEPDTFAVSHQGAYLALDAGLERPPSGYRLTYYTKSKSVLGQLDGLREDGNGSPHVQRFAMGGETRQAVLLPPPGALAIECRLPPAATLRFGHGFRSDGLRARGEAVRHVRSESDGVGFRLEVVLGESVEVAWERFLPPGQANRFHDVSVSLADWAGKDVRLQFSTFGSAGEDGDRDIDEAILDDFAMVSAPFLAGPSSESPRPNVLVVLVDTLRSDVLTCYGGERGLSPVIDGLAEEGVLFENAYGPTSWTLPSIVSFLTAMHPTEHGVDGWSYVLGDEAETLPEALSARGWRTAAFTEFAVSNGMDQGFERFVHRTEGIEATSKRALEWIRASQDPFFCFLHTYEVHTPYQPPQEFRERLVDPYEGELPEIVDHQHLNAYLFEERTPHPEDIRYIRQLYEAGVAYTDRELGELFDALKSDGIWEDTFVILVADHGEEFCEHGAFGHSKTLYEESVRIPMILRFPGAWEGGRRVAAPVRLYDLAPTILELVDIPQPQTWTGLTLSDATPRELLGSLSTFWCQETAYSLRKGSDKWIQVPADFDLTHRAAHHEIFDLKKDPRELENLWTAERSRPFQERTEELIRIGKQLQGGERGQMNLSDDEMARLKALGY